MKLDTSPKTVMAITLIVMLGLLFGTVGYLIINKRKEKKIVTLFAPTYLNVKI